MQDEQLRIMERRDKVSQMYIAGIPQHVIGQHLGVSQPCISDDLRHIREGWKKDTLRNFDEKMCQELSKIDNIERKAYEAWDRSCKDAEIRHKRIESAMLANDGDDSSDNGGGKGKNKFKRRPGKPTPAGRLVPIKALEEITHKGQCGNPAFLERMAWCVEMRCKIFGILKPDKQDTNNNVVVINWGDMLTRPERTAADEINDKIDAVGRLLPNNATEPAAAPQAPNTTNGSTN